MTSYIALGLVTLLVVGNAVVTLRVAQSAIYGLSQKRLQYLLIWLLPVLGAVVSWGVLRAESRSWIKNKDDLGGNPYLDSNYPDSTGSPSHHPGDGGD